MSSGLLARLQMCRQLGHDSRDVLPSVERPRHPEHPRTPRRPPRLNPWNAFASQEHFHGVAEHADDQIDASRSELVREIRTAETDLVAANVAFAATGSLDDVGEADSRRQGRVLDGAQRISPELLVEVPQVAWVG